MPLNDIDTDPVIYTLSVHLEFGLYAEDECVRVIEIADDASLEDLHLAIQDAVSFDNDHLYDFYAGRHSRQRKIQYTEPFDDWEMVEEKLAMILLREVYPLDGLKLYYLFDFGDSWTFEIRKSRKKPRPPEPGVKYPRVIERRGPDPQQYPIWDEDE